MFHSALSSFVLSSIFTLHLCMISTCGMGQSRPLFAKTGEILQPEEWKAKWIWLPGVANHERNHMMLARKTFALSAKPDKACLYISADSHYRLWINGVFVARGPARCNPHHQSYDIIDVTAGLRRGENLLAVQVHYHGVMKSWYTDPYPGLLVQLETETGNASQQVISDLSWKVMRDNSWNSQTEWVNRVNANNFSSCIDFSRAVQGWNQPAFDDSRWASAVFQTGPSTWPPREPGYEPYARQRPWFSLVPRDIPPLTEKEIEASSVWKVLEAPQHSKYPMWSSPVAHNALYHAMQDVNKPLINSKVINLENFLAAGGPLTVENAYPDQKFVRVPVYHTTIVFDFGGLFQGYPTMKMAGSPGTVIDVNYAPYLVDGAFIPGVLVDNFSDRLILSGNTDQWESMELRPLRYMAVTVRGPGPVVFERVGFTNEEYPFESLGTLQVPGEPFIEKLWSAAENTIRCITTDAYTDNYHENRQYVQTSYYASRGNYAAFGDTYLQRRYLLQHAQDQLPDGIMPMWAPWNVYDGNQQMPGILEASHFWLMGLYDYFLFSGDSATVHGLLENADRCAVALFGLQVKDNLIYKPPHPYWIDWAKLAQGDHNFIINALQALAFREYSVLLSWMGHDGPSAKWRSESDAILLALKRFWNPTAGLFSDNLDTGIPDNNFSEHANALALVAGVANPDQSASIVQKMISNSQNRTMEEAVLFNYWIAEALCSSGHIRAAVDMLKKKYLHMIEDGETTTLWEYANLLAENTGRRSSSAPDVWRPRTWSAAQAENAFPPSVFSRWVLGLHPSAPGMREISLSVSDSPYTRYSGTLPTPKGVVRISRQHNLWELDIPDGISMRITDANLEDSGRKLYFAAGDVLLPDKPGGDLILPPGRHELELR